MRLRAVAWDVDGTLVDSEPLHHRALVAASLDLGVDLSDLPDEAFRGVHILDVWETLRPRIGGRVESGVWLAAIERYYVEHRTEIAPIPEAAETVRALFARGTPQVCVSNSSRAIVAANLDALDLTSLIAFSICLYDVAAGKPDPEPYRKASSRLGLRAQEIVAVEDSVTGVSSAHAAGLYVVGYSPLGERFEQCHRWIQNLSEISALFAVG
jgi:HAD superfamily hydrolase (TIGR01509 family)